MHPLTGFAGPAWSRSGVEQANGWVRASLKDVSNVKTKTTGKGMKLHEKTPQNNPQKGIEEELGSSAKLQIIFQCPF